MLASQALVQARCNLVPSRWSVALPCTGCLAHGKVCKFCTQPNVLTLQTVQTLTTEKTKTAKSQRQININILLRDDQWLCLAWGKMCKFCTQHQSTHSEYCENVDNCAKCKNMNTKRIKHPPPLTWSVAYWLAHSTTLCKLSPAWNEPHEIENSYIS